MTPATVFSRTAFLAAALALLLTATSLAQAEEMTFTQIRAGCNDPAAPEVDWSACYKPSADLSGADLTQANLTEANLTHAVLTGAVLTGADLSGADLRGADLTNADLTNAILVGADLSEAIWTDGRFCAQGSIGTCN